MLIPVYKKKFSKGLKLSEKRGKDIKKFKNLALQLIKEKPLARRHKNHPLKGKYSDCRECHIEPDWLLI